MSDTGAEAVKRDPRCSWERHSGRVGAGVGDESTESLNVGLPVTNVFTKTKNVFL